MLELGLRSTTLLEQFSYPAKTTKTIKEKPIKSCQYSPDGSQMALLDAQGSLEIVGRGVVPSPVTDFRFSPLGRYVSVFHKGEVAVYQILDMQLITQFKHKQLETWQVGWSMDEAVYMRVVGNSLAIYGLKSPEPYATIDVQGISGFSASTKLNTVCTYSLPLNGGPGNVRLHFIPKSAQEKSYPLSQKTVMNVDTVMIKWSLSEEHCLVQCTVESDKSNRSYYGQSQLYLLTASGNYDAQVKLDKEGPVHDFQWIRDRSGLDDQFIVVYGDVPARATLFNHRGKVIHNFGDSARNTVRVSEGGRFVLFGGYGNLAGHTEVYDLWQPKGIRRVGTYQEDAAVYTAFAGVDEKTIVIVSATLSPRLRVDNRFRIRSLTGDVLYQKEYKELFWCQVVPQQGICKDSQVSVEPQKTREANATISATKSSYVPPHLRGKAQPAVVPKAPAETVLAAVGPIKSDKVVDIEKKIIQLQRKLRNIEKLHMKLASGDKLEANQMDKLGQEDDLKVKLGRLERDLLLAESEQLKQQ